MVLRSPQHKLRPWERLVLFLFPELEFEGTPWRLLWQQEQRSHFRRRMAYFGGICSAAYALHFFAVDLRGGVQPIGLWIAYRTGMTLAFLMLFILAETKFFLRAGWYRIPAFLVFFAAGVLQARSMLWEPRIPLFFAIFLPVLFHSALGLSIPASLVAVLTTYAAESSSLWKALENVADREQTMVSSYLVGCVAISVLRSGFGREVRSFIQNQRLIEERQKTIELQGELVSQTKGFAPKEIFERILELKRRTGKSLLQATDDVLRPRRAFVACVYADIRDYSKLAQDMAFLRDAALPAIQHATEVVEEHRGIPRLVGDLVFAYYDFPDRGRCITSALISAVRIAQESAPKGTAREAFRRYLILACGEAVVGNIGGVHSAREVTCLGNPANLVQRLDELTKQPPFAAELPKDALLLSRGFAEALQAIDPGFTMRTISLEALSLSVRSFPEEREVWILPLTPNNVQRARDLAGPAEKDDADVTKVTAEDRKWSA